jgi:dienelactone hydrolase
MDFPHAALLSPHEVSDASSDINVAAGNQIPEAFLRRNPNVSIDEQKGWSDEDKAKMHAFPGIPEWTKLHPVAMIDGLLADLAPAVRKELPSGLPLVASGYCFGGKYVLRLARSSFIDAGAAFHPVSSEIFDCCSTG